MVEWFRALDSKSGVLHPPVEILNLLICHIPRLSLNKKSTVTGGFLITCP